MSSPATVTAGLIDELISRRTAANARWFENVADQIARLCHQMAERFARGGRLIAFGASAQDRSDVRHVTVEFVHPVIVGKRALPAVGLTRDAGGLVDQVDLLVGPEDIAVAYGDDSETAAALQAASRAGCLTVSFGAAGADARLVPAVDDPFVRQELTETAYHVLWELVHVFFEHRGLLRGRDARAGHDPGASSFLYPFLGERESDLEAVIDDVRRSVLMKSAEIGSLRAQTLADCRDELAAVAAELRERFDAGARMLAVGNGGSATDAMDVTADFRAAPQGWPARPALDLTEDAAILTAIANDVGVEEIFQRQVIAHGRMGDVLLVLSTSGGSANVIEALREARRRGLLTIAMVGYDGGRIASESEADHLVVVPSEHIPRIQEAQASAYHLLRELTEVSA